MDPVLIATGALAILKEVMAAIDLGVKAGQISVETQQKLHGKIDAIRDGDFSGPEWQVSDTPPLPGPHTVADATKPDL